MRLKAIAKDPKFKAQAKLLSDFLNETLDVDRLYADVAENLLLYGSTNALRPEDYIKENHGKRI